MESHHEYRINAFGAGGRNGVVQAEGVLSSISFSAPPEFLGEPGRWTPEHFLVAAVASCFISTFSGIAEKSRFESVSFHLEADAILIARSLQCKVVLFPAVRIVGASKSLNDLRRQKDQRSLTTPAWRLQ
jgi:organic hydroperoxide reductase OsmC/OhrA